MDIADANLEGPITPNPSVTLGIKNAPLQFTFDPSVAPELKSIGFTLFGLANNHTDNFGSQGLTQTRNYLAQAGLSYYGDPDNADQISTIITVRGIKIGFVGFHEYSDKNLDRIFAEISRLRPIVDYLVVFPHWGVEYQPNQDTFQEQVGHAFIDHGADVVISASPHVVQPIELYKGKPIFFSLGNFEFDQYFSDATSHGLALEVDLTPAQVSSTTWRLSPHFTLLPINIGDSHPQLDDPTTRLKTLANLSRTATASPGIKQDILDGWLP